MGITGAVMLLLGVFSVLRMQYARISPEDYEIQGVSF